MFEIELYKIGLNAKDSSLLVIDPPECSSIRKILAEFLFEKFECKNLCFQTSSVTACYAHCLESATIIDVGGNNTRISSVIDGRIIKESMLISNFYFR